MSTLPKSVLGVDIGGTGIKAAIVDTHTGTLLTERHKILTPKPATPQAVAEVYQHMVEYFRWDGVVGCGFPAIIQHGVARSAANIDDSWIGVDVKALFEQQAGLPVTVLNDADVAGMAEMAVGAGAGRMGTVMLITLGTGLGSALFTDGKLVPNTEFGHFYLRKHKVVVEKYCSNMIRKRDNLSWIEWTARFNEYLKLLDRLFTPDLYILGGGGSKHFDVFKDMLVTNAEVVPAVYQNRAGVIGAAVAAATVHQMVTSS